MYDMDSTPHGSTITTKVGGGIVAETKGADCFVQRAVLWISATARCNIPKATMLPLPPKPITTGSASAMKTALDFTFLINIVAGLSPPTPHKIDLV